MREMKMDNNILSFQRPPRAPVVIKKRTATDFQWIGELDPMASVRRAIAADPAVEGALKEIERGSLQNIVRKAIEK
jgi:hypothetical protein